MITGGCQSLFVAVVVADQAGYAVIFLTRTGSIQPFTQDLPLTDMMPLLQSLVAVDGGHGSSDEHGSNDEAIHRKASYRLQEPAAGRVAGILQKVDEVQRAQLLLSIPFTTIFEYLQVLMEGWSCSAGIIYASQHGHLLKCCRKLWCRTCTTAMQTTSTS